MALPVAVRTWVRKSIQIWEFFTRDNLDRLFSYYSRKHPDKSERLQVKLFATPRREIGVLRSTNPADIQSDASSPLILESDDNSSDYDAFFFREGEGTPVISRNEWYTYVPDPTEPKKRETVLLRGRLRFLSKEVLDTWEVSNGNIIIRASSYKYNNLTPVGTYYTFEYYQKRTNEWHGIFTVRSDKTNAIPREQVRFEHGISYVFMGWMYAVSLDDGNTWKTWDAETDLPDWECCDGNLIRDIRIASDGTGIMKIKPTLINNRQVFDLYTTDFGQHWRPKQS